MTLVLREITPILENPMGQTMERDLAGICREHRESVGVPLKDCNILQYVTISYNTLLYTIIYYNIQQYTIIYTIGSTLLDHCTEVPLERWILSRFDIFWILW